MLAPAYTPDEALKIADEALGLVPDEAEPDGKPDGLPPIIAAADMVKNYPTMRPVVVESILRQSEVANIIASSKVGKTHLAIDLALAVATGRAWLGRFAVTQGKVLYVDAELHRETFSRRLASIVSARGIMADDLSGLDIWPLRGNLKALPELSGKLLGMPHGTYRMIVVDALYRLTPDGFDENSNRDVTGLYNLEDRLADATGAAIVNVHHASKGIQTGKGVTDVGSGAGAQSRAVDAHLILRPHEETDCVVLEGALRSFPALPPLVLRWTYPTWNIDDALDPTALAEGNRRRRKPEPEPEPDWTPERFVTEFVKATPRPQTAISADAKLGGVPARSVGGLISLALERGLIFQHPGQHRRDIRLASVKPDLYASTSN